MEKKNLEKKTKLKRHSKIYKNSKVSGNIKVIIMKYIFVFLLISLISYFFCVAVYSFINREHVETVDVPSNYGQETVELATKNENKTEQKNTIQIKNNYEKIIASGFSANISKENSIKEAIDRAKKAGKNAMILCLKDEGKHGGYLKYKSETELAKDWKTFTNKAYDIKYVKNYCDMLKEEGIIPICKISAFSDDKAPDVSRENSFLIENVKKNGKEEIFIPDDYYLNIYPSKQKWLNPCCYNARKYILDLICELKEIGFSYILLDNMRFPDSEFELKLENGEKIDKAEVLKSFIKELNSTGAKVIIPYDIAIFVDEKKAMNCFGGDISKYGIIYQSPTIGLSSELNKDISQYKDLLKKLRDDMPNIDIITKIQLHRHANNNLLLPQFKHLAVSLKDINIDSYID